jgi:hypothetical protein
LGLDITYINCYYINTMEIDNSPTKKYILVDWTRPLAHERLSPKPIKMREKEAHMLNQAMATNGQNKRYVRSDV